MTSINKQGELWGTAPQDWALNLEITFIPVYKKIINKTGLSANHKMLDIGCGSGLFIRLATATGAKATGIDLSTQLLAIARERNPTAILLNEDMENLSFEDNSFDLVSGFNSLQYAEDKLTLLKGIKKILKEDGKLVIGIWGTAAECEALKVLASIASLLPEPVAGSPGPLALSGAGDVEELLAGAGFKMIENSTIECPWNFSSLDDAVRGILSAGPSVEAIQYAGLEKVKEKLINTLEPFNIIDDIYVIENVFHYYIAGKA